ncbi:hypothetical protein OMW55_09745 [Sphingomonas sp. BN140010]|uniref:Glycosyl-hydrolase 97 C-terminal oligomerisation domain-containing protein n=1 Tax=Sphingomonas arvum TaxID=2992113 RepID=A0ABT3JH68_9SPHN|nr:hypothetical protein [Sphingomonas sp. BN140010]MCW3798085.1 hypothetical protein [Sphingomonas sp. BN140010]
MRQAGALQSIKDVAVDWEDTLMLAGEIGQSAVIARKKRGRPSRCIGGIMDEQRRLCRGRR